MKKIVFGLMVALVVVFTSCLDDDDGYSLNDIWIGFGVLSGEDGQYNIILDSKDVLVPVASNYVSDWMNDYENGDRVLLNYTILDEELNTDGTVKCYYVKVNEIDDVLMKGILDITSENSDSIGYDPIVVQEYWLTDSLLNFKLKYWGYNKIHFLNLVKQPGDINSEDQPIQLELKHNANGDDESIAYTAFVSFSLNDLRIAELDSVRFEFTSTDYDGMQHSKEEVFNYGELELP